MKDIAVFAETTFRNESKKFGIKTDDRRRHMYLIGKTGMGKSTILENMIVDDIRAGHGVAVVDPHGDLAEKIIEYIPAERVKDVIYFNPSDINFPIAFNVVEQVEPHLRHLVASGLIGVFQKLWADSWGPRLEYILRNAVLAILDFPGSTLLGVVRMLSDKNYRKRVVANIKDPVVKSFWEKEFSGYADKFASEAVSPIQNKVGQFLSSSLMRNVIGQVRSSIDIRDIMDNGKILIMNLSKGRIGEDNSALLGAMMITKIQLAAMSRVDVPEIMRRDFYLYIDEFQNFSTDSFANILSEARKYRLNLILAHQYIEQLSEKVKPAVFGNVGTMVVFRVGAADAEELVKEFTPTFTEEDIVNLPKYEMYLKLMIDGIASSPFSARGLPPLADEEKAGNAQVVIDYSREKYASRREEVEEKIMNWHIGDGTDLSLAGDNKSVVANSASPAAPVVNGSVTKTADRPPLDSVRPVGSSLVPPPASAAARPVTSTTTTTTTTTTTPAVPVKTIVSVAPVKIPAAAVSALPKNKIVTSNAFSKNKIARRKEITNGYNTVCSDCGRPTITIFEPDGIRPVYCRECLSRRKEEKRQEAEQRHLAKAEELRRVSAPVSPLPVASLSLNDLKNLAPRDFRGREIKTEKNKMSPATSSAAASAPSSNTPSTTPPLVRHPSAPERDLKEGEEISITNNNF